MQRLQRLCGIRTSLADQFHVQNAPAGPIFNSERGKREALVRRGPRLTRAEWLIVCWNQHDFIKGERCARCIRCIDVTDVNGIECATEDAQPSARHAAGMGSSLTAAI